MIAFGVTNALGSFFFGTASKYLGRVTCLLAAACINFLSIGVMLHRTVEPDDTLMIYGIPALWGLADSAWQTQINSLYGLLFYSNQEAAFSNFRLWESLGFAISYAYSAYICTSTKLYLLLVYLVVGLVGYLAVEASERQKKSATSRIDLAKLFALLIIVLVVFSILIVN